MVKSSVYKKRIEEENLNVVFITSTKYKEIDAAAHITPSGAEAITLGIIDYTLALANLDNEDMATYIGEIAGHLGLHDEDEVEELVLDGIMDLYSDVDYEDEEDESEEGVIV